ncbi:hypothetical protein [Streptomyces griseomycini]|uniref:Integral membrane protein n=1 Tax=Streptomyces griseomycini TaxID=66895 RepID=A0A7W7LV94_9ACTN|nr:hypothetical protein [Streptomyces griseomycini]MBB4897100.1 hypothetical protein [Streptomyces griseomycini]GGR31085.1 hypothetical protein GCM10015536_40930 [Streptomyces griseomycini]
MTDLGELRRETAEPGGPLLPAPDVRTAPADEPAPAPRRGAADPVKALLHRHRELCEQAVDPLEIAAGLEAHGVTDRTAARFRHRDVFSLAEELYARVPRDGDSRPPAATAVPRARADWIVLTLLPGALCAASLTALRLTHGQTRLLAAAAGVLAVALALRAALRRGPLSTGDRTATAPRRSTTASWTCWLIGYALLGDGLLGAAITGGPDGLPTGAAEGDWPFTTAPVLALALACAPAAWTAHLFSAHARRRLASSRGLEDFAASARPALLGAFALFLCALAALLALSAAFLDEPFAHPQTLALGALLLLARLLTVHGFTHAPKVILVATVTAQAAALATVFAARLPGCAALATPVDTLVTAWGPAAVPTLTCGAAALILLVHASRRLTRASAHTHPERPR